MISPKQYNTRNDDDEIDFGALFLRLWANKFLISAFTLFAGITGLIIALGTPPIYKATALLQLEEKSGQLALPESLTGLAASDPRSVTEIEIIKSRLVLGRASADAQVDWRVTPKSLPVTLSAIAKLGIPIPEYFGFNKYVRPGESLRLDLLEVPEAWLGLPIQLKVTGDNRYQVALPNKTMLEGVVEAPLGDAELGFALRIGDLEAARGREFTLSHLSEDVATRNLLNRLSVSERGRQSGILELSLSGDDIESTERTLNAIMQAYLRQNLSRSAAEAESSLVFVESQIPGAEARIREAEQALNKYRQAQQAIDLGFEGQNLLTQVNALEDQLQQLNTDEVEIADRYTRNHPVYQQLLSRRSRLEERLQGLRTEVAELPETQREVLNLTRNFELAQSVYVELLNRAQELRVLRASTIGNVRIIDAAKTDNRPVAPNRSRVLLIYVMLGLFSGTCFVLLRGFLRRGIQSADAISGLDIPVFATLNLSQRTQKQTSGRGKGKLEILALTDPADLTVEGCRSFRTSLHFAMLDAPSKAVALTSSAPQAGKSFTSVNLAVVSAQAGQSVCLVDADLRRGCLRRYFDVSRSQQGLAEYLSGQAELDDILVKCDLSGVNFIPTGVYPPNPSELLMRPRFKELISELDNRFDLIIIDTPPVLAVTDPIIVGNVTGATIAVVRFDVTTIPQLEVMKEQIEQAGGKLSGAVLNGFDPRKAKAGALYGYTYRYDYRRSENDTN